MHAIGYVWINPYDRLSHFNMSIQSYFLQVRSASLLCTRIIPYLPVSKRTRVANAKLWRIRELASNISILHTDLAGKVHILSTNELCKSKSLKTLCLSNCLMPCKLNRRSSVSLLTVIPMQMKDELQFSLHTKGREPCRTTCLLSSVTTQRQLLGQSLVTSQWHCETNALWG